MNEIKKIGEAFERFAEATPGPWWLNSSGFGGKFLMPPVSPNDHDKAIASINRDEDAEFIVKACNSYYESQEVVREQQERIKFLERELEERKSGSIQTSTGLLKHIDEQAERIKELEAKLASKCEMHVDYGSPADRLAEKQAETIRVLREGIEKYGNHQSAACFEWETGCICGLKSLLATSPAEKEK